MHLTPGDIIEQMDGPFLSTWIVTAITDAGAVLAWTGSVSFRGYPDTIQAPNGAPLTSKPTQGFLGRAHWDATTVIGHKN